MTTKNEAATMKHLQQIGRECVIALKAANLPEHHDELLQSLGITILVSQSTACRTVIITKADHETGKAKHDQLLTTLFVNIGNDYDQTVSKPTIFTVAEMSRFEHKIVTEIINGINNGIAKQTHTKNPWNEITKLANQ